LFRPAGPPATHVPAARPATGLPDDRTAGFFLGRQPYDDNIARRAVGRCAVPVRARRWQAWFRCFPLLPGDCRGCFGPWLHVRPGIYPLLLWRRGPL